jgi:hypothetical protein
MNSSDKESGVPPDNTFEVFDHAPDQFPFTELGSFAEKSEIWGCFAQLSFWTMSNMDRDIISNTVLFSKCMERALAKCSPASHEFWSFYATTLLLFNNPASSWRDNAALLISRTSRILSPGNRRLFLEHWNSDADVEVSCNWPCMRLAELVFGDPSVDMEGKFWLIRQIMHNTYLQIGFRAKNELPLMMFLHSRRDDELL